MYFESTVLFSKKGSERLLKKSFDNILEKLQIF